MPETIEEWVRKAEMDFTVSVREFAVNDDAAHEAVFSKQKQLGRPLTENERGLASVTVFFDQKPEWQSIVRVQVCENPWARINLPRNMFCGTHDERWAMVAGKMERVWHGDGIGEIED